MSFVISRREGPNRKPVKTEAATKSSSSPPAVPDASAAATPSPVNTGFPSSPVDMPQRRRRPSSQAVERQPTQVQQAFYGYEQMRLQAAAAAAERVKRNEPKIKGAQTDGSTPLTVGFADLAYAPRESHRSQVLQTAAARPSTTPSSPRKMGGLSQALGRADRANRQAQPTPQGAGPDLQALENLALAAQSSQCAPPASTAVPGRGLVSQTRPISPKNSTDDK